MTFVKSLLSKWELSIYFYSLEEVLSNTFIRTNKCKFARKINL
jgi:hypothetical protein